MNILEVLLDGWFHRREAALGAVGLKTSITWGPGDLDRCVGGFESATTAARLIVWSTGEADLAIIDVVKREVVLQEYREIWTEVGLNDVETTVRAWLE
jgi:hypothetical protein